MVQQRLSSGAFYVCPAKQEIIGNINDALGLDLRVTRLKLPFPVFCSSTKEAPLSWTQTNNKDGVHISWMKRGGILKAPASQEPCSQILKRCISHAVRFLVLMELIISGGTSPTVSPGGQVYSRKCGRTLLSVHFCADSIISCVASRIVVVHATWSAGTLNPKPLNPKP